MNKVRSTVKHMPRKAKLLTALLACVLVLTLIGVGIAAEANPTYIHPAIYAEDVPVEDRDEVTATSGALELSRPTEENCPPFNGKKQENGEWKNESWAWDGSKVTGTVEAINDGTGVKNFKENKGILRITNTSENTLKVSFRYGLEFFAQGQLVTKGTLKIGDNNPIETNSTAVPFAAQISAGESIDVLVTVQGYQTWGAYKRGAPHATLTITDITAETVSGSGEEVTLLAPGTGGSYTYKTSNGTEETKVTADTSVNYNIANKETVTLTAQPEEGYKFYLWEDRDGKILSATPEFVVRGTNGANPKSVRPVFVPDGTVAYYHIPDGILKGDYYYWQDAMSAARTNSNTNVVLLRDLELNSGMAYSRKEGEGITDNTLTIPSDVTLVVPYSGKLSTGLKDAVNVGDAYNLNSIAKTEYGFELGYNKTGEAYRTLTVSKDCTLNVNGTLLVNAVQGATNGDAYNSHVLGGYGQMIVTGKVNVNDGGKLYARGYVTGEGKVEVLNNGTLYQMLQLVDWRGGNYSASVGSPTNNSYPTLPFSGYYLQNNMVHTTYCSGSSMKAQVVIAAMLNSRFDAPDAEIPVISNGTVDDATSLFVMGEDASVETVYDKSNDQLKVTLNGDTSMKCLKLNVGGFSLTTEGKELAISDNIQVTVASGKMTIAGGLKFLPGAKLTVAEKATLEIANKGKAFFYAKADYNNAYTYNAWRNKLQAADVIESTTKVTPTENADLDLQGSLVINGTLALSKSHPGLTANNGASVTVNHEPVLSDLLLYEPYMELKNNTGKVPDAPVLDDGDVEARLVASDKGEADYVFENRGWTAPKGAMVDDGSTATLEKGTTYKAHNSKWYSHKITVNYSGINVPATPVYTTKNECTFTAPKGYVITNIDEGETGITAANAVATDITPNSEGWRSVKLSNITAQEATLTATVKAYGRTVTWECKTGDKTEQSYSYLPANATKATLTFNGIVQINENGVKVNGNAPAANQITISEADGKTSVKVTDISADTTVTVPYSASFTVTWKVKTDKGQVETTTSRTEMNSATYALHNNSNPAQKFWNVVEDAAIKLPTSSAAKVQARSNTDDIILTNVFGDTTVEIDITTYKHKVTTSTTVYKKAADVKKDLAETIVTFVNEDTYKPALTKIKAADKYVVSKYEITGGTLGSKQNADVCAILPKDVSIALSGKDVVVSLELQSYLYVWNWDATLDGNNMQTNSGFTYTEYLTDRPTGEMRYDKDQIAEHPCYYTLRDYGEKGRYFSYSFEWGDTYFDIDYRSMGNNRFTTSRVQEILPEYPGAVVSLKNGVLSVASDERFSLNDASVTVALVSYTTKVTVKDGTNNGLPEGIFYANADGKDATSGEEIVYGAFDNFREWDYYAKYLFVKGYTIGIAGESNPTTVDNVGALLGYRFYEDARLNGLTISADTVKSAAGGGSGKDLTVTLTDLAKYYQVYAVSEDGTSNYRYLMFVQSADRDGPAPIYAPKAEKLNVSCTRKPDDQGILRYYPTLTVKEGNNSFFQSCTNGSATLDAGGKTLNIAGNGSGPSEYGCDKTIRFTLTPYDSSLTWNVGNASGTTYVTEGGKAYCDLNSDKTQMLEDTRYSKGTWTYTVPTGQTVAPNGLTYKYCDAVYEGGKVTVSGLTAKSTVSITTSPETSTDADTYYMGDMSFEYVRNAAAFTWDGVSKNADGSYGSWKPVNSFGWRHAVGSKSYEVGGETLTVDNGSILFVNTMQNTPVTYTVQLSRTDNTNNGVSLKFDTSENIQVSNDGVATVTVPANSRVTLVCRMTGTPDFSISKEIVIGNITVTKN